MARFKAGDILDIFAWDVGDERWQNGIIRILKYHPISPHTKNGIYLTQRISGQITWLCINAEHLDEASDMYSGSKNGSSTSIFLKYLGNMPNSKTAEVLYGKT